MGFGCPLGQLPGRHNSKPTLDSDVGCGDVAHAWLSRPFYRICPQGRSRGSESRQYSDVAPFAANAYVQGIAGRARRCLQAPVGRLSGAPNVTVFGALAGNLNRQRASQAAGFAAVTIAAVALISWWVSPPLPSSWGSGFATVKPTTALCLAAVGLAVVYPGTASRFVFAIGLAVAAVAGLDFLD